MDSADQLIQHGSFLRERGRHDESVAAFKQALAQEPSNAYLHFELAITYLEHSDESHLKDALESIDQAIGYDPEYEVSHAVKGLILIRLNRDKEARRCAEDATALYPDLPLAWLVKGQSYFSTGKWALAEEALRQALAIDPGFDEAKNMLTIVLRAQGRVEEASVETANVLSRNAEDPTAHANAGWAALQNGNRQKAEEHFKEALCLNPENEYARDGLREAYKARSIFYRLYLKYVFFMQKFSQNNRFAIFIGIYVAFRFGKKIFENVSPLLAGALVVAYLTFAFWTFLANGIGHFLILKDSTVRLTLNKNEKLDGLIVGGGFVFGLILGVAGFVLGVLPISILGGSLAIGALPWSRVFLNNSKAGRITFGGLGALVYALGLIAIVLYLVNGQYDSFSRPLIIAAIAIGVGSTWLSMVPQLSK